MTDGGARWLVAGDGACAHGATYRYNSQLPGELCVLIVPACRHNFGRAAARLSCHVWHAPLRLTDCRFVPHLLYRAALGRISWVAFSHLRDNTRSPNTRLNVENAPSATRLMLSAPCLTYFCPSLSWNGWPNDVIIMVFGPYGRRLGAIRTEFQFVHNHRHYGFSGRFVATLAMVLDRFDGMQA